jgi:hypothetical protein
VISVGYGGLASIVESVLMVCIYGVFETTDNDSGNGILWPHSSDMPSVCSCFE